MYLQWVSLGSLFVLCNLRDWINKQTALKTRVIGLCLCMGIALLVECSAAVLSNNLVLNSAVMPRVSVSRLIALLISFLVLFRLFDLLTILERRHQAESESKLSALQSRIRPHFLFNSLNTISELTATKPEQAEEAIGALSMLFRANLETDAAQHSLQRELDLCEHYIDLERWRLGKRLQTKVIVGVESPSAYLIPKLLIQPLVENAIVHGMSEQGDVDLLLDVRETASDISIKVDNTKGGVRSKNRAAASGRQSNGIAVDNIRERLFVLYDDQHTFRIAETNDTYSVLMRLPKKMLAR